MGAFSGGHCFPSAQLAAQAECNAYPRTSVSGDVVTTWSCSGAAADGSSLSLVRTDTTGATSTQVLQVAYPDCDDMQPYNDAVVLWGLILTAAAGVYAVKSFVLKLVTNQ